MKDIKPLAEIKQLYKTFKGNPSPAIADLSANIYPGEITGLVGPDGAGKTTLIRLMTGLLHPDQGSITIDDLDTVSNQDALYNIIGYMPQKFGLYEDLSVIENLNLYADLRGLKKEEREQKLEKLLHFTQLLPFKSRLAGNLSGGMKQKLGIACA